MPRTIPERDWVGQEVAADDVRRALRWLRPNTRWLLLTGAGVSTPSGIPAYRDSRGVWQHKKPMTYQEFIGSHQSRQRYWARTVTGYERIRNASPNPAHTALAELERLGLVELLVTQNVDGLHLKAGSRNVVELHGRLRDVRCLACGDVVSREVVNAAFGQLNPAVGRQLVEQQRAKPDGDVDLQGTWIEEVSVPNCARCGGLLKPDVVFFGENVPAELVQRIYSALERASGLLVLGSSLSVFSGYRFARRANELGLPIVIVNQGQTRADELAAERLAAPCQSFLPALVAQLAKVGRDHQ